MAGYYSEYCSHALTSIEKDLYSAAQDHRALLWLGHNVRDTASSSYEGHCMLCIAYATGGYHNGSLTACGVLKEEKSTLSSNTRELDA